MAVGCSPEYRPPHSQRTVSYGLGVPFHWILYLSFLPILQYIDDILRRLSCPGLHGYPTTHCSSNMLVVFVLTLNTSLSSLFFWCLKSRNLRLHRIIADLIKYLQRVWQEIPLLDMHCTSVPSQITFCTRSKNTLFICYCIVHAVVSLKLNTSLTFNRFYF